MVDILLNAAAPTRKKLANLLREIANEIEGTTLESGGSHAKETESKEQGTYYYELEFETREEAEAFHLMSKKS